MEEKLNQIRKMIDSLEMVMGHPNLRRNTGLHQVLNFFLEYFVPREKFMDILEEEIMKDPMRYHRIIDRSLAEKRSDH